MNNLRIIAVALMILMTASVSHAAGSAAVAVSATVLSKSNCKFSAVPGPLSFGSLNPLNSGNGTASATITFRCGGSAPTATFIISQDSGLYKTGPNGNRMRHATVLTEYLPYALTLSPTSGTVLKNVSQTVTVSGTITAPDYQNAYAGNYADTVVISLNP